MAYESNEDSSLRDKVIHISRHAKVVKGGRRFSFAALVVVGDGAGKVGIAKGKAKEVPDAIKKGFERAKREMRDVKLSGHTIPHEVMGHFGSGRVYMRPAAPGTGVIAGGATRAILEAVGVRDVFAKSHGTSNPANVAKATIEGLLRLRSRGDFESLRTAAPTPPAPPRPAAPIEGMPEDQPQG
ncbi:MAG: 30S ribosomal protein S5 [Bdellovibrionota bacterium]